MTAKYALITVCRDEVAPRFDMTAEVLITPFGQPEKDSDSERRHLVLAHVSSEELCDVITRAGVSVVVCGGIEEDYYHYLRWKRIDVICDVMGPLDTVLEKLAERGLNSGDCLYSVAQQ
jgi:hypothetical protein